MMNRRKIELGLLLVLAFAPWCIYSEQQLLVKMTLVQNTSVMEAYCLDGSLPAYHLHRGFGAGARNWLLQFEGGGWCNDIESCLARAQTHRGSTRYMNKLEVFSGILTNNASLNPDFYNWNRVKIRYCDGASFAGDATFDNGTSLLYFRGQRIWKAIILDLLPKGLQNAKKGLKTLAPVAQIDGGFDRSRWRLRDGSNRSTTASRWFRQSFAMAMTALRDRDGPDR